MNSNKKVIGLTGLYCSGKSTVEKILKYDYDYFIIDVDKLGHKVLIDKKEEIVSSFGEEILVNRNIDRRVLGNIVFRDKTKLKALNKIVHPVMIDNVKSIIEEPEKKLICINAALLFEMGLDIFCNTILVVKAPIIKIIIRARKRDNNSIKKILRILHSQKVLKEANKSKNNADIFYINNNKNENLIKINLKNLLANEG